MEVRLMTPLPTTCAISGKPMPAPQVGDRDIVVDKIVAFGLLLYELERFGYWNVYDAKYFAVVPELSAEEMRELEHEAIIYQR